MTDRPKVGVHSWTFALLLLGLFDHDALVGTDGRVSDGLFAIGPLTRGRFWEVTAVPDIRVQAASLAGQVAESVRAAAGG